VTVSWGFENRVASIRLIAPPVPRPYVLFLTLADCVRKINQAGDQSSRCRHASALCRNSSFNVHTQYLKVAALFAAGFRGIEKKLKISVPPLAASTSADLKGERLPKTLSAATDRFMRKLSIARDLFGDDFVDHFGGTREHELREFEEAITDWELVRYMELA